MKMGSPSVNALFTKMSGSDRLAVVFASLLVVAASMLVLLVERAIQLAQSNVALQFRELEGAFNEQERFLLGWKLHDADVAKPLDGTGEAAGSPPAWALVSTAAPDAAADPSTLARNFIDFYRDFWSQSRYRPSQCLLVNASGTQGILVPSKYASQYQKRGVPTQLRSALERVRQAVQSRPRLKAGYVAWAEEPWIDGQVRYVAVTSAPEDAVHWGETAQASVPAVACLMETHGLLADLEASEASAFTRLSVFTPGGALLIGDSHAARDGPARHFGLQGLELRMKGRGGWTAVYTVGLRQLLLDNHGTLMAGGLLAVVVGVAGALLFRARRRAILAKLKAHEERLQESQDFSRAFLDSAPVGVCLLRTRDGSIVLDNVRARRFLGGDHDHGGWQGAWRRQVQSFNGEQDIAYTTPDGRHLLVSGTAVRFDGEDALLCLFVDVTLQQKTEQAMRTAQAASEMANQAKSQFLAMISHEIRTPLYGVLGTLELLGLTALDPRQREYLRTVEASSATLMHLIDDILDISKAEAGQLQLDVGSFSPTGLTEDIVIAWNGAARRKGLSFYAVIDSRVPAAITGDAARIRQVLNNLLSNAFKFTEQGRVSLHVSTRQDSGLVCWQVTDSGMGIPSENQARLFERFYQVHPGNDGKQGTGLGLAICALLAGMMGGKITVTSEPGLGSSFTLEIPASGVEAALDMQGVCGWTCKEPVLVGGEPQSVVHSLVERLGQRGISALAIGPTYVRSSDDAPPLLEILLGATSTPVPWDGPHVVASYAGGEQPEYAEGCWWVTPHRLDAIIEALALATGNLSANGEAHSLQALRQLGLTVLVAEDNPINQAILRGQLEQLGCPCVIAADGREALSYCTERPFSLLLTDLNMPVMDGYALASAIRGKGLELPIIGTTANADPGERERCGQAGMDALLIKPITLKALQSVLLDLTSNRAGRSAGQPPEDDGSCNASAVEGSAPDQVEPLVVPARHHDLFVETMTEDLAQLREAMAKQSAAQSAALLHRICGALTLAGATRLAERGGAAEDGLRQAQPPPDAWVLTGRFLDTLEASLQALSVTSR
ncbi:hybrid sensor histidine kinase/response regulator [Stenotrophomonas maltophilia]|uniref:hybrid sensor histidine kinase/response regulator n=1 Tax=Stenotrophomonas maltophilia TaxID=40324 RepID=UPI0006AC051B|nr:hybrid sensor histidine kinase/response regulator [Stenotrophomonas maltophilia]